jgi:hypothetical protein
MNFFWQGVISAMVKIFASILGSVEPGLKAELSAFLTDLYKKALATPNPMDDFVIGLLLDILGIPRPTP